MSSAEQQLAHRYRLKRSLGQGGMGHVWLADDSLTGGEVAVKVLTEQLAANQASILQVKQEFRLMTQLRHPHCCEVYDYGFLANGQPYFTMEVVPGQGLDQLLPLSPDRFKPLFIQLMQALAYVHQRGYVHSDIKSENVRIRPDGTLKLMDFGLMLNAGASGLPIRGTLGYLPPEVIKRAAIDQRSDLYAAGCLAFEMLTGQLPFMRARPMEVLQAHLGEAPPLPGRLVDAEGLDWVPVIATLLAKDPIARFQSAEDVLEALGVEVAGGLGGCLLSSQLVGRDAELALLQGRLERLAGGEDGGAVVVEGGEGLGKSRLLAELRVRAQLEHLPFGLGACQRHGHMPLGAIVAAFRSLLPAMRNTVPALLAQHAPALVGLLPELGGEPAGELDSPDKEKARLFGAIAQLLYGLAEARGLALALENWQWADALSSEFLTYLLRNRGTAPLLVVVATQRLPEGAPWAESAQRMPLGELDKPASARLIGSMLGTENVPEDFLAKMHHVSGGNPQLLEGALEHLVETLVLQRERRRWAFTVDWDEKLLPASRLGLLHRRLAFLADDVLTLARVAAVIGKPTDLAELMAVADFPEERLFSALEPLIDHQVLKRGEGDSYVLDHDMMIPLLYDAIAPAERERLHDRALGYLEQALGDRPLHQAPLEALTLLARHAAGAGDAARGIRYALEAGKRSTMIFANDEAARLLESGLTLVRSAPAMGEAVLLDYTRFLADVYRVTGRYEAAMPLYREAVALAEATGDTLTLGRVLTSLAKLHMVRDQLDEALEQARRALSASRAAGPGPVTLRAMLTEVRALFYMGQSQAAAALADEALVQARALGQSNLIAQALSLRGYMEVASPEPDVERGVRLLDEASARFAELGDRLGLYNATNLLGNALMSLGDFKAAASAFDRTRELAFELGAKDDETFAWLNMAVVALERGQLPSAIEAVARAEALATALQSKFTLGMAMALGASARALSGSPAGAARVFEEALAIARTIKSKYMELLVRQQQVETLLYLGASDEALEAVRAWKALKAETGNTEHEARSAALEAQVLHTLGRHDEAAPLAERALAIATATRAVGDAARAHLVLARLATARGQSEQAIGHVAQGLECAQCSGTTLLAAELHGLGGECALATGRPAGDSFKAMAEAAREAGAPAVLAVALFGLAAASPYESTAPARVKEAQSHLEAAQSGLEPAACSRFQALVERRRVIEGNHIAYSLPSGPRERRAPTGPLGMGLGGL